MRRRATKKAISMALAAAMAFAPAQAFAASSDIKGHWAESAITSWQDKGLISGYTDGTFKPDNSVTRAEFASMVNKALGLTEKGDVPFSDVKSGSWYYDAISIAVKAGYCSGYEDGTFKPDATITRAEAAVMISLAKGLTQNTAAASGFADAANIPAWAKGYVGAVVSAGYMSGRTDGTFDATNTITRAEAVSSLDRAMGNVTEEVTDKDVVVTEDDTVIDGQTIEGNLIIDKAVGEGEVYVKNTTVAGNIIVQGGGDDSIYLENVTVKGKVVVEKSGVRVQFEGKTEATDVEVKALCELKGRNFEGKVGTITIAEELGTSEAVEVNVPAEAVVVSAKASVSINANVDKVTIASAAKGTKLEITSGTTVGTVVADGEVAISGSGKVEKLEANADGITISSSTNVTETEVADGVEKPSTPSTGGGGGGSSSGSTKPQVTGVTITNAPTKIKPNSTITLTATVNGKGSYDRNVTWSVTGGATLETKIDEKTGELTVGAESDTKKLTVTATSVGDNSKKATAEITVEAAKAKTIELDKTEATLSKGSEVTFVATVKDQYDDAMEGQSVTWTVENSEGSDITSSLPTGVTFKDGKLTVGADAEISEVPSITVKAAVAGIETPATATVTLKNEAATVSKVVVTPETADVKKGATQEFTAEVQTAEGAIVTGKTVTWSVEGKGEESTTDIAEGTLTVAEDETAETLTVKAQVSDGDVFGTATVKVIELSNDVTLSSLTVKDVAATLGEDGTTYSVVLPVGTDLTSITAGDIVAKATNEFAVVAEAQKDGEGSSADKAVFTILVTAENKETKTYTINITKEAEAIKNVTFGNRTDSVAEGQPTQVNDGKYTIGQVSKSDNTYTIPLNGTTALVTDQQGGSGPYGKYIGVCVTIDGVSDISKVKYSKSLESEFTALEQDEALKDELKKNSFMFYLNAADGNEEESPEIVKSSTLYIRVNGSEDVVTLNFNYTPAADPTTGAKAIMSKITEGVKTVEVDSLDAVKATDVKTKVEEAIKALDLDDTYNVTVAEGEVKTEETKTTWSGEVTVTSTGTSADTTKEVLTVEVTEKSAELTKLTKDDVIKANITNRGEGGVPFTSNDAKIDSIDESAVNTVKVLTEGLKEHQNGDEPSTMGYWTGFAVKAPEGATQMKYILGKTSDVDLTEENLSELTGTEEAVDGVSATGIAFYADVTATPSSYDKLYYAVQFFNANGEAVTAMYKFKMDLSGVTIAGDETEVASGTVTGTKDSAFSGDQKVTIDLTNDTFKADQFTSGSSDTIDDAKSWVTNLSDIDAGTDAVTVKAVKKSDTQVELVFEGTPDTVSTAQISITIPDSVLTKGTQVVITPSESAKFAVAE